MRPQRWLLAPLGLTALVLGTYLAYALLLPHRPATPNEVVFETRLDPLLHFDGGWFLQIVLWGYRPLPGVQQTWNFFPLFPMTVVGVHHVFPFLSVFTIGIGLNVGAIATSMVLVDRTVQHWPAWQRAGLVALLLSVPGTMYWVCFYSEPFLVLGMALTLFGIERPRRLRWAVLGVLIATTTRAPGALLAVPLGVTLLMRRHEIGWRRVVTYAFVSGLGLPAVVLFDYIKSGDALAYVHAYANWDQEEFSKLGLNRALHIIKRELLLRSGNRAGPAAVGFVEDMLAPVLIISGFFWRKRVAMYSGLAVALIVVNGGFPAQSRYLAALLPLWIGAVGGARSRKVTWVAVAVVVVVGLGINLWFLDRFVTWRYMV